MSEKFKFFRHSPSSLDKFATSPSMFVLEKVLGRKTPVGASAFRGTAVEDGVAVGLLNPDAGIDDCIAVALKSFDRMAAFNTDPKRDDQRAIIAPIVANALAHLRPYGIPSDLQGEIEWHPAGLKYPIFGKFDFHWSDSNTTVDLKTSEKLPGAVKEPHARQVSLYVTSNNADARVTYVTPKKIDTYRVENTDAHRAALHKMAIKCEAFLALSEDPEFFVGITAPNYDHYYWNGLARQIGFEVWGF